MPDDLNEFKRQLLEPERVRRREHDYAAYHRRRYEYILDLCTREVPNRDALVLDVGPSPLSSALAGYYDDVTSIGFKADAWARERGEGRRVPTRHIEFDLNDAARGKIPVGEGTYDLVVFAETVEHLHAAPELVLRLLHDLLRVGGLLVCQTPNAAALHKRAKLLIGIQPYERIRVDERHPGHLREYTRAELLEIAEIAGLKVVQHEFADDFGAPERRGLPARVAFAAYRVVQAVIPSLRRGQTLVARR